MKFFWRSKDKSTPIAERKKEQLPFKIAMTGVNYEGDLFQCDVALKIWLPESIEANLDEISDFLNISVSDFIRQIIFLHLYGRYNLLGYVERHMFMFTDPDWVVTSTRYSLAIRPASETTSAPLQPPQIPQPDIPKVVVREPAEEPKINGRKVFIPTRMKEDLLVLAQKKHHPLSEYTRRVIITHLFGHQDSFPTPPAGVQEGPLD